MREIEDFKELGQLNELDELNEIEGLRVNLGALNKEYRDIHAELFAGLGADAYAKAYNKYEDVTTDLRYMIIEAKKKLRKIERTERRRGAELVRADEKRKERDNLRAENEFLVIILEQELGSLKLGKEVEVEEINKVFNSLGSWSDVYLKLHGLLKGSSRRNVWKCLNT